VVVVAVTRKAQILEVLTRIEPDAASQAACGKNRKHVSLNLSAHKPYPPKRWPRLTHYAVKTFGSLIRVRSATDYTLKTTRR